MGVLTATTRAVLDTLVLATSEGSLEAKQCTAALGWLYEELAATDNKKFGKYGAHLLADYVAACCDSVSVERRRAVLTPHAAAGLRPGAHALMGACGQHDLEGMFAAAGSTRRLVLVQLKEAFDRDYKYTGKV